MKKIAIMMACVVAICSLLTGCGDDAKKINQSKMEETFETCGVPDPCDISGVTLAACYTEKVSATDSSPEYIKASTENMYYECVGIGTDALAAEDIVNQYVASLTSAGFEVSDEKSGSDVVYVNDKCSVVIADETDNTVSWKGVSGQYGLMVFIYPEKTAN